MHIQHHRGVPRAAARVSRRIAVCWLGLATLCFTGCRPNDTEPYRPAYDRGPAVATGTVYVLAVHPLHNPQRLFDVYQPLVQYLNAHLKEASIRLEASSSYAAFEAKMARRELAFCLSNPYQTVEGMKLGYHVFAKLGDDQDFRGIILVRKDSGITHVKQLIGKTVSYPAPTALAAGILPQWFLHEQGINVQRDIVNNYVGTQESSIMNVVLGKSTAAASWPPPWRAFQREHPELASQLEVRWQTPSLVNNAMTARDDLPPELVRRVGELLTSLHTSVEGRSILARMEVSRFEAATDATYEPVSAFLKRFESEVRLIKDGG